MNYTLKIGGEAGQGIQTIGEVLALLFARSGYHVFTNQDYESRIRGGHNFYQIRFSSEKILSPLEKTDIVIALDRESATLHRAELAEHGIIAYDSEALNMKTDDPVFMDVPFRRLAVEQGGSPLMANTVATGAALGMLGASGGEVSSHMSVLEAILKKRFLKKGDAVIEANIKAARAGFKYAKENCKACRFIPSDLNKEPKILLNGLDAAAIGALASGLKFYSAYPMTPSTGIMDSLAAKAHKYGIIVEQAEDEIAAINMALGASFMGVRAATGSSGGGFALMVEGLSLAAMTETPIVIFEGQRPGPATGLPTRTEQGDLLYIAHTAHGEFPRVVFAPGSPKQAIFLTNKAFDLAEKYQIPVFVVFDQHLADSEFTYDDIDSEKITYNDYRLRADALKSVKDYKRHAFTDTGVSPLAVPGESVHLVVTDSDEHDEEGHIVEDAETRIKMVEKRLFKKLPLIKNEISPPSLYGDKNPELALVCWGSTYGAVKEAVDVLIKKGRSAAMLFFNEIYPLPDGDYIKFLENARDVICVEGNATGQFARLLRMERGIMLNKLITRYDGRPFSVDYIIERID